MMTAASGSSPPTALAELQRGSSARARVRSGSCATGSCATGYPITILTQVAAAARALQSVALELLEEHLGPCVTGAVAEGGNAATAKVKEASDAIAGLVRS
jgi:hypothetical protein